MEPPRMADGQFRAILDGLLEGCQIIDREWRYVYVNDAVARQARKGKHELLGSRMMDVFPGIDQTEMFGILEKCMQDRAVSRMLNEFTFPDGSRGWFELSFQPVAEGVLIMSLDVTEVRRADDEVRRLNADLEARVAERTAELQAANHELDAFTYSVTHDLRAPLRAIDGFCRILVEDHAGRLEAEGKRLLGSVRANAQRMDQLITDLLHLAKVGRGRLQDEAIDMAAMASAAWREIASADPHSGFECTIGALPPARGDPVLLQQVWANLISNAVKYTLPKGERRIEIGGRTEPGWTIYYVKDTGVGFDPAFGHKLFGVFERLHRLEEFEGTGVGLAIVRRILERHGGRVWAEGAVGVGATISFALPAPEAVP